jgi:hypothetical protein
MFKSFTVVFFFVFLFLHTVKAQTIIQGEIIDMLNNEKMDNVNVRNVFTLKGMTVKKDGRFEIEVRKGELIEISKIGYQTIRIRIHNEKEPSYYKVAMEKVPIMLREVDIRGKPLDFEHDSIRYRETYDAVLRKQRREEIDMRSMPLAMLSKKNRQEWAFQEMYEKWEQEKYIDFVFNEKLVSKITYLKEEDLKKFMRYYRPSYHFVRTVSDYEYLDYIKSCYYQYKKESR